MSSKTTPPNHLSPEARLWWKAVVAGYSLEPHHTKLLQAACEAWDRTQQARETVEEHGVLTKGRYEQLVANPATTIEKENRALFARLVAQLDLDSEPGTGE